MKRLRRLLTVSTIVAGLSLSSLGCERRSTLPVLPPDVDADRLIVGARFPDLMLPSLYGTPRAIGQFRGEKLILHIFASW